MFHENRFVTDFKQKAELFNSFFAKQCSIIDNGGEIPSYLNPKTDKSLSKGHSKSYTEFRFKQSS